ncbi:MAG: helix-turn-helix domain-containing protein [Butyricicoccus sp.]|nr:helix-turn-helix domain-containing protein [Butyricicoccus sp.]
MNTVLKHYEGYITALATRCLYDENGVQHLCVDDDKRKRLEIKLITKILDFEIVKAA